MKQYSFGSLFKQSFSLLKDNFMVVVPWAFLALFLPVFIIEFFQFNRIIQGISEMDLEFIEDLQSDSLLAQLLAVVSSVIFIVAYLGFVLFKLELLPKIENYFSFSIIKTFKLFVTYLLLILMSIPAIVFMILLIVVMNSSDANNVSNFILGLVLFGVVFLLIYYILKLIFINVVVITKDLTGWAAIKASAKIVNGRWWKTFLYYFLFTIILGVPIAIVDFLFQTEIAKSFVDSLTNGTEIEDSIEYLGYAYILFTSFAQMFVSLLGANFLALMYKHWTADMDDEKGSIGEDKEISEETSSEQRASSNE